MKLKLNASLPDDDEKKDDIQKPKKVRIKNGNATKSQYGIYSGIVNDDGKTVKNPTEVEAVKTMAKYMKNNQSDQSDTPSNTYRPQFNHLSLLYKKKSQNNA